MSSENSPVLSRPTRQFIVLLAMLQGLLLYLARTGQDAGWWPFASLNGCVYWYTLVLAVPSMMLLSVLDLRQKRFWWQSVLVATVFALVAAWAGWSASGDAGIKSRDVLLPMSVSMALALFVALPHLQAALRHGRWNARYADLFELAWQNALTLILTAVFVGICWLLLTLWGRLFALIGIDFFWQLFKEEPFVYLATGLMVGLGILIGRTQQRPVQVARRILFAIFTGLLPLLALIAVLFVLSLPMTGLASLWATHSATMILLSVVAVMVLFVNAVYQDGSEPPPYPRWLRLVVEAGLLVLPVFAVLALYALALRIGQYGWTQDRIAAMVVALLLGIHAFGYALAVLRRKGSWLACLPPVNVLASLVAIALTLLLNSPVLDPHRMTAQSQIARLESGKAGDDFDIRYLRFSSGRQGWLALQALQVRLRNAGDVALADRIAAMLKKTSRYGDDSQVMQQSAIEDAATLQQKTPLAAGSQVPDADWWAFWLEEQKGVGLACRQPEADCVLLVRDMDKDGQAEHLLCDVSPDKWAPVCRLYARVDAGWALQGELIFSSGRSSEVRAALRRGELRLLQPRWPVFEAGGAQDQIAGQFVNSKE